MELTKGLAPEIPAGYWRQKGLLLTPRFSAGFWSLDISVGSDAGLIQTDQAF